MRYVAALLLSCFGLYAVETPLTVDTYQPRATLTQLTSDQGGCINLRVTVLENQIKWRGMQTNDVFVFQWSTNRTTGPWDVSLCSSNDILKGSSLIPIGPLAREGSHQYEIYLLRDAIKYPLGTGRLVVEATTGYGEIVEDDMRRPLNTDIIVQEGSNLFVRTSDLLATADAETARLLKDYQSPSRYLFRLEYGTGIVYVVEGPLSTNTVSISPDFKVISNEDRPEWTTRSFPFDEGNWSGGTSVDYHYVSYVPLDTEWKSIDLSHPATLLPVFPDVVQGSAVVSQHVYYATNELYRFLSEGDVDDICEALYQNITNTVTDATNGLTSATQSVRYGDLAVTNQTGYASFSAINPSQRYVLVGPGTVAATNTISFQWPISGGRVLSASSIVYLSAGTLGVLCSSTLSMHDINGVLLSSNVASATLTEWGERAFLTNVLANTAVPSNGVIRLAVTVAKTTGQVGARLYVGGVTPLPLFVSQTTSFFATAQENEAMRSRTSHVLAQWYDDSGVVTQQVLRIGDQLVTNRWGIGVDGATNITDGVTQGTYIETTRTFDISAITQKTVKFTNGTTMADGVYNTTNGVFFTSLGTNYWILFK